MKIYKLYYPSSGEGDWDVEFGYYTTKEKAEEALIKYKEDDCYGGELIIDEIELDFCDLPVEKIKVYIKTKEEQERDEMLMKIWKPKLEEIYNTDLKPATTMEERTLSFKKM